jgi:hypothetical protein
MIALTVFCAVGQFVRVWYGYEARMRHLEADRSRSATAHQHTAEAGEAQR